MDYREYLSVDNGHGVLLSGDDVRVLNYYGIDYMAAGSVKDLILLVGRVLDETDDEMEDLELVMDHLLESHYYNEVNK